MLYIYDVTFLRWLWLLYNKLASYPPSRVPASAWLPVVASLYWEHPLPVSAGTGAGAFFPHLPVAPDYVVAPRLPFRTVSCVVFSSKRKGPDYHPCVNPDIFLDGTKTFFPIPFVISSINTQKQVYDYIFESIRDYLNSLIILNTSYIIPIIMPKIQAYQNICIWLIIVTSKLFIPPI